MLTGHTGGHTWTFCIRVFRKNLAADLEAARDAKVSEEMADGTMMQNAMNDNLLALEMHKVWAIHI